MKWSSSPQPGQVDSPVLALRGPFPREARASLAGHHLVKVPVRWGDPEEN